MRKIDAETFLKQNKREDLIEAEKRLECQFPGFWQNMLEIDDEYRQKQPFFREAVNRTVEILRCKAEKFMAEKKLSASPIHSISIRVKSRESLIMKLIIKESMLPKEPNGGFEEIEKYRDITPRNFTNVVTDLGGMRIIVRYSYQLRQIHQIICETFGCNPDDYVVDWKKDDREDDDFIAEQPIAYLRSEADKIQYSDIKVGKFKFKLSDKNYESLHYIVHIKGAYIEIQVRTILDEAWCEADHDYIYKNYFGTTDENMFIERMLSSVLAENTQASEHILNMMCYLGGNLEIEDKNRIAIRLGAISSEKERGKTDSGVISAEGAKIIFAKMLQRAKKAEELKESGD